MKVYDSYIRELKKFKVVNYSIEEEKDLIKKAQLGCLYSRDILIKNSLLFALKLVKQYLNRGIEETELISASHFGLINAVNKYDLKQDVKFITYAKYHILTKIREAFYNNRIDKDEYNEEEHVVLRDKEEVDVELLNRCLSHLNAREREIIEYSFGINKFNELTNVDVADRLNLSSETIRLKVKKILNKLNKWANIEQ